MKMKRIIWIMMFFMFLSMMPASATQASTELQPLMRGSQTVYHFNSSQAVMTPKTYAESDSDFRAVWVATVFNLNMPVHTSETQYKQAFQDLVNRVLSKNMNAIIFQVRPMNDAFYESEFAPFSRYLTGAEGNDPGWDVMQYMIDTCHEHGIEFHAWLNPYRVANSSLAKQSYLNTLHPTNFARQNPDLVVAGNLSNNLNPYILNPGEPLVKAYIENVVTELIEKYNVDGIHFDDYFYPYSGISSDVETYQTYKKPNQTIEDFRRESVNDVVRDIKTAIDLYNDTFQKTVRFGISPFGIWRSGGEGSNTSSSTMQSYRDQYADSKKWVEEGWLHYICPQVYWSFSHNLAPYADIVDWWAQVTRGTGVDLIIGLAISNAHSQNWLQDEIFQQIKYNQKHPEIKGVSLYSASFMHRTHLTYVVDHAWQNKPLNTWADSPISNPDVLLDGVFETGVYRSNVTASISSEHQIFYKINQGQWLPYEDSLLFTDQGNHILYVKAVDDLGIESLVTSYNITIEKLNLDVPTIHVTGEMSGDRYLSGAIVTLTANEPIYVAINYGSIGEYAPYTGPITLEQSGNYFIRAKTINNEGIESQETTLLIRVVLPCYDTPTIHITGQGSYPYFQTSSFTLTSDAPSISYKINTGAWINYTSEVTLNIEGEYTISYRNNDGCMVLSSENIVIDQTPPEIPEVRIFGTLEDRFYVTETTVELIKKDTDDVIKYRLHNGSTWSSYRVYETGIELILNANYTIEFYAIDLALNETLVESVLIRVNIPPSEDNVYVIRDGQVVTYYNSDVPVTLPSYQSKQEEIRAVWVATVHNIDLPLHTSQSDYQSRIILMLDRIKANHFNTIFFQVRPMNDAFYASSYAPFSRFLTGVEGQDPGWDVLAFMIEEAHKRGIEFHAWLNPYRVSTQDLPKEQQLSSLHPDNFARQNPDLVMVDNNQRLLLNPGEPLVRSYIRNVISELMQNYAVDGIHFDDYFYSYSGMHLNQDAHTYDRLKKPNQTLSDWRRENVDLLVEDLFHTIDAFNESNQRNIKFGISPFGIWKSQGIDGSNTASTTLQSFKDQYADSKKWVEQGWLHYIVPQLYWEFSHHLAPFADLVDWWAELCDLHQVDLIIGQGFYRYADHSWKDANEFLEQLRYMSQYDIIKGSAVFSYRTLNNTHPYVTQALERLNNYYWTESVWFPWETDVVVDQTPTCEPGQIIEDGKCVDVDPTCEPGQIIEDGKCVDVEPTCQPNHTYDGSQCVPDDPIDESPKRKGCFGIFLHTPHINYQTIILPLLGFITLMGIAWIKKRT